MDRLREAAKGRVLRLLEAARVVAADLALRVPLAESTGLSFEGVGLAVAQSLETQATADELDMLVRSVEPASRVHVILSANVFTAPLRALAVAWAASEQVTVRPSRRDPVFAGALVHNLGDARVTLAEAREVSSVTEGEIHVYGRDETVLDVQRAARVGVIVRGHGAGMGIAFVDAASEGAHAAAAIADDVVLFDQRGCLSPRIVLVEGDVERADAFAEALHESLARLSLTVPRGRVEDDEQRDTTRYVETMSFAGRVRRGDAHVVGVCERGSPVMVPPPGRCVHVVAVGGCDDARAWLAPVSRFVVAIGCDDMQKARALVTDATRVRVSRLGSMQRPPLDGPVDLRRVARVSPLAPP